MFKHHTPKEDLNHSNYRYEKPRMFWVLCFCYGSFLEPKTELLEVLVKSFLEKPSEDDICLIT